MPIKSVVLERKLRAAWLGTYPRALATFFIVAAVFFEIRCSLACPEKKSPSTPSRLFHQGELSIFPVWYGLPDDRKGPASHHSLPEGCPARFAFGERNSLFESVGSFVWLGVNRI